MVKLNKIYTRTGDDGTTGLGTGKRVRKADPRVIAYGVVDEANAFLAECLCRVPADAPGAKRLGEVLIAVQNDLFDVGADLCIPIRPDEDQSKMLRITAEQTQWLESVIDEFNAQLKSLTSFVLPGGSRLSASLHIARTVCRRAERDVSILLEDEPKATSMETMRYLNRLSDLLFVLARSANRQEYGGAKGDVLWIPGKNRSRGTH
ncbi:MAG: cob(I)yrinic acid a,c-diamide adenosyltransferase [Phycisphaerales bacterium]|nr:cob(I)yrinic acid a,c-diamide adenosyltransferase [Phycisphaerales bacterium]